MRYRSRTDYFLQLRRSYISTIRPTVPTPQQKGDYTVIEIGNFHKDSWLTW